MIARIVLSRLKFFSNFLPCPIYMDDFLAFFFATDGSNDVDRYSFIRASTFSFSFLLFFVEIINFFITEISLYVLRIRHSFMFPLLHHLRLILFQSPKIQMVCSNSLHIVATGALSRP